MPHRSLEAERTCGDETGYGYGCVAQRYMWRRVDVAKLRVESHGISRSALLFPFVPLECRRRHVTITTIPADTRGVRSRAPRALCAPRLVLARLGPKGGRE